MTERSDLPAGVRNAIDVLRMEGLDATARHLEAEVVRLLARREVIEEAAEVIEEAAATAPHDHPSDEPMFARPYGFDQQGRFSEPVAHPAAASLVAVDRAFRLLLDQLTQISGTRYSFDAGRAVLDELERP